MWGRKASGARGPESLARGETLGNNGLVNLHHLAEARSIAYHRAVAERLRRDPALLEVARRRVEQWIEQGQPVAYYAHAWREVLSRSPAEILGFLVDQGERAVTLRQVTPFAGFLDPRERWRLWRQVRAELEPLR